MYFKLPSINFQGRIKKKENEIHLGFFLHSGFEDEKLFERGIGIPSFSVSIKVSLTSV